MKIDPKDIGCTEEELYDFYLYCNHMVNCRGGTYRPNDRVAKILKMISEKIKSTTNMKGKRNV